MRSFPIGLGLAAVLLVALLVAPPTVATADEPEEVIPHSQLPALASGARTDAGWAAVRLALGPERVWSIAAELAGAQPHAALGLFVYDQDDRFLGSVTGLAPETGEAQYHFSSEWAPLRFETHGDAASARHLLGFRLTMECGACSAETLRVVAVGAGAFDAFRWSAHAEGASLGGLTEGGGAFVYRGVDFHTPLTAQVERDEALWGATVEGWRDVDVPQRLVGLFDQMDGAASFDLEAIAPEGTRSCPCAFPDGHGTGGAGAYGFHATAIHTGGDLLLFGASVEWP